MTVATLIAILQGCKQNAEVFYPNMEIDKLESIHKIVEIEKDKNWPEEFRYQVVLR